MRTSLRALIGLAIAIAAVFVAVTAFASPPDAPDAPVSSAPGAAGTCIVEDPDCNDTVGGGSTDPGQMP